MSGVHLIGQTMYDFVSTMFTNFLIMPIVFFSAVCLTLLNQNKLITTSTSNPFHKNNNKSKQKTSI